ncbi:hypothetical protein ACIRG4_05515 [Streptomyces sp. NPDC102395]|uniref:hypothetical protein n=1 Tax=Streptomyces sp. NPDC102395 TaxID=3366168 RepID=UPI003807E1BA
MTEHTPSQAEGDREEQDARDTAEQSSPDNPTPSQAEGDRDDADGNGEDGSGS